jgi:hypothetical protein
LGWVPFKGRDLKRKGDAFRFAGRTFRVFNSRALPEGKIKDGGNFARDRKGNWLPPGQINGGVDRQDPVSARRHIHPTPALPARRAFSRPRRAGAAYRPRPSAHFNN